MGRKCRTKCDVNIMASRSSAQSRAAVRKQRDKWRSKRWYTLRAPRDPWQYQIIGETLAESDEQVIGRVYELTQQEFDGDFTKMHVKLKFRISSVIGQDAITEFVGHSHMSDHTRRQIRRHRAKFSDVVDAITKDGYLLRVKPLVISEKRMKTSVKKALRSIASDKIISAAARSTYSEFQKLLFGLELENEVRDALNSIHPLRSVALHKSELLQSGISSEKGPTLEEIKESEKQDKLDRDARKAAAIKAAEEGELDDGPKEATVLDAAQALEDVSVKVEDSDQETDEKEGVPSATGESVDFSSLPGVGKATAEKISAEGYSTFEDLKGAGVDKLSAIKGVSEALAQKIIEYLD